ncbi:hypothetical protein AVEN_183364-1 [Araneus ventricosus]|uniref:Uncharacterized protein n=1 Tax=Araneus ventricosus TaxID=182803 RepID=A0A4Y2LXF6_ARAVE|nr:hypothetical protein AVEN_183364-1 [Araneus ventricosus]
MKKSFNIITINSLTHLKPSRAITGTRSFHCFVPVSESNLKCFITSQATEYEIHSCTTKAVQITISTQEILLHVHVMVSGGWQRFSTNSTKKVLAYTGLALTGAAGLALAINETVTLSAGELVVHPPKHPWSHNGLISSFDHASIRRGYEVYKQVCSMP